MNDWATDFLLEYEEDGIRHTTIWAGFTREEAIETFEAVHPGRHVIGGKAKRVAS